MVGNRVQIKTQEVEALSTQQHQVHKSSSSAHGGEEASLPVQPEEDGGLNIEVHQKPTHIDQLDSHHPWEHKLGVNPSSTCARLGPRIWVGACTVVKVAYFDHNSSAEQRQHQGEQLSQSELDNQAPQAPCARQRRKAGQRNTRHRLHVI